LRNPSDNFLGKRTFRITDRLLAISNTLHRPSSLTEIYLLTPMLLRKIVKN